MTTLRLALAQLARLVMEWATPDDPDRHPVVWMREAWQMADSKDPCVPRRRQHRGA
jgi:hypothetical protein